MCLPPFHSSSRDTRCQLRLARDLQLVKTQRPTGRSCHHHHHLHNFRDHQRPRYPLKYLRAHLREASRLLPSSLTSPSHPSSRPTPEQWSRVSSTLHSHSHAVHPSQRSNWLSTESTGHTNAYNSLPPPAPAEGQLSTTTNGQLPGSASSFRPGRSLHSRKQHRYCQPCGIIKPPRANHRRTCDTVRFFLFMAGCG